MFVFIMWLAFATSWTSKSCHVVRTHFFHACLHGVVTILVQWIKGVGTRYSKSKVEPQVIFALLRIPCVVKRDTNALVVDNAFLIDVLLATDSL